MLLSDTDVEGAEYVTTNIMKAVHELKIPHATSDYEFLSLSIGVISIKGPTLDEEEILEQVDKCLYLAKEQGRNGFISYKEKLE